MRLFATVNPTSKPESRRDDNTSITYLLKLNILIIFCPSMADESCSDIRACIGAVKGNSPGAKAANGEGLVCFQAGCGDGQKLGQLG